MTVSQSDIPIRRGEALLALLLVVLVVAAGCHKAGGRPGAADALAKLPVLETIDGAKVDLPREGKGKVVVLNRWATWCGPCRMEIPSLVALGRKYKDDGLLVFGLSDEEPALQRSKGKELGIDYPLLRDLAKMPSPFEAGSFIPQTFIVARDGRLAQLVDGARDEKELEEMIVPLLKEAGR